MTVSSTTRTAGPYVGTGSVSTYPFAFKVFQASDVLVTQYDTSGNATVLTLTSQYSVTLNASQNTNPGGTITLVSPLPLSYQLFIGSQVPELQGTSITNNGGFYPQVIESALDYLTILTQQISASLSLALKRSLISNVYNLGGGTITGGATAVNPTDLPTLAQVQGLVANGAIPLLSAAGGSALVGFQQVGTGSVLRTVQARLYDLEVSVKDFGATGNGVTDDTAAIQTAINACVGKTVYFPPGTYKITSSIHIVGGTIRLRGARGYTSITIAANNIDAFVVGDGTLTTRNLVHDVEIMGFIFQCDPSLTNFTTGSCIYLNYCYNQSVTDCYFYGSNGTSRLWNGITISKVQAFYISKCMFTHFRNVGTYISGGSILAELSVDGYLDNCEYTDCLGDCVFLGAGSAGLMLNKITAQAYSTWGIHINTNPGGNFGQNIFIMQPDLEADGTSGGIYLEFCQNVQIIGGWIGVAAAAAKGVWFGLNAGNCRLTGLTGVYCPVYIDGAHNAVSDCDLASNAVLNPTGITVTASAIFTMINNCRIWQWATSGIAFQGNPQNCVVTGCIFKQVNGQEITGQSFSGLLAPPVISGCQTDASASLTAAASVTLHQGRLLYQITGTTNITTMTALGVGQRVTMQAAAGGNNFTSGGNIHLKTAPTAVPAFSTISFVCDGTDWYEDGRNF